MDSGLFSSLDDIQVGCSGWVYRHWRGIFYPPELPQSRCFGEYSRHFATVEINNSFYRLPSAEAFDKWREQAPPGFRYAVKVNRFLTHMKKLRDCAQPLERFATLARRLGDTLGPLLYQLPPQLGRDDQRLADFLALLPRRPRACLRVPLERLVRRRGAGAAPPPWRRLRRP